MAHKKGVGSSKNGRESESKRLGVKIWGGQFAKAGNIIVRQRGTVHNPGENMGMGSDHTLYALVDGIVTFHKKRDNKSFVSIQPIAESVEPAAVPATEKKMEMGNMKYKLIEIEGIGEIYAQKLEEVGLKTTKDLLEKCSTSKGRAELEEATKISGALILKWTNHADLMRINGIAGQFAELLEAAGVDTVKEFRHRIAANLQPKLQEINDAKNLCNRVPSVNEVEKMIAQAKEMQPLITY